MRATTSFALLGLTGIAGSILTAMMRSQFEPALGWEIASLCALLMIPGAIVWIPIGLKFAGVGIDRNAGLNALRFAKRHVKNILRPPKYRVLENHRAQIEPIVRRHLASEEWHSINLVLHGRDCIVADVNDAWIFKFPRHEYGAQQLEKEARTLAYFGERLGLRVPELTTYNGKCFYSCHPKIPGDALTSQAYQKLTDAERDELARTLALFFARMHSTSIEEAKAALRLQRRERWKSSSEIIAIVEPLVPSHIHPHIRETMARFDAIEPSEADDVIGHFDAHGKNMAFDFRNKTLSGLFDFADIGIGDFHKDIQATSWISTDLTLRVIPFYEAISSRIVDRGRVSLLHEAAKIINVAYSKDIKPQVVADFVREYETRHLPEQNSATQRFMISRTTG